MALTKDLQSLFDRINSLSADAGYLRLLAANGSVGIRALSASTTGGTPTEMTADGASLTVNDDSIHSYTVSVTAKCTGGTGGNAGKSAFFRFEVLVKSPGGTTAIVGDELKSIVANDRDGIWDANVAASPGKLTVLVTGAANDNITWVGWVCETTLA